MSALGTLRPLASESGKWLLPGRKRPFNYPETYRRNRQLSAITGQMKG